MVETPQYTYPLLTKRPVRLARMADRLPWPSNVWVGVSIEHRAEAWRADQLREVPAASRFISAEPLLGPLEVDLGWSTRVTTAVSTSSSHDEVASVVAGRRLARCLRRSRGSG
jgi:protein gp37